MLRLSNKQSKRLFKDGYPEWDKDSNGNLLVLTVRKKYDKRQNSGLQKWCEQTLSSNYIIKNNIILKSFEDYVMCKMMPEYFSDPIVPQAASLK